MCDNESAIIKKRNGNTDIMKKKKTQLNRKKVKMSWLRAYKIEGKNG